MGHYWKVVRDLNDSSDKSHMSQPRVGHCAGIPQGFTCISEVMIATVCSSLFREFQDELRSGVPKRCDFISLFE